MSQDPADPPRSSHRQAKSTRTSSQKDINSQKDAGPHKATRSQTATSSQNTNHVKGTIIPFAKPTTPLARMTATSVSSNTVKAKAIDGTELVANFNKSYVAGAEAAEKKGNANGTKPQSKLGTTGYLFSCTT